MDLLRRQVHTPADAGLAEKTLSLLDTLAAMVPIWEMYCNKEPDAAKVAYSAMSCDLK
jgi:hypothetical protein